jgi:rubrerythrin
MMSPQIPDNIRMLGDEELNMAVLRVAVMAEFDNINTYEQILAVVRDEPLRRVFLRLIGEEKLHAAELQDLLMKKDAPPVKLAPEPVPEPEMSQDY